MLICKFCAYFTASNGLFSLPKLVRFVSPMYQEAASPNKKYQKDKNQLCNVKHGRIAQSKIDTEFKLNKVNKIFTRNSNNNNNKYKLFTLGCT